MILWAKQFVLMPGHPSDDCLPTWLTSWLHCVTNAQSLAYIKTIAQFLNKRFQKQGSAIIHNNGTAEEMCPKNSTKLLLTLQPSKGHFFIINETIKCTDIIFYTIYFSLLSRAVIYEISRSHTTTHQSVGLLWTNDQLVAETSTWQHT